MRRALLTGALLAAAGAAAPAAGQEQAGAITLEEALQLSLEHNRDLRIARQELAGADGRVREAWSAVYPTVNFSGSYTRNLDVPGQFLPARFFDPNAPEGEQVLVRFGADNSWFGQLRLEQPVFQASALVGVGAAGRYRALQGEVVRGKEQEVLARTRKLYYDVLLAQEAERLNGESLRRVRETLEETRAMHRAGLVGDYDVLRLEVELANLEPAVRRAEHQVIAARRALGVELAMEDGAAPAVVGSLAELRIEEGEVRGGALTAGFALGELDALTAEALVERAARERSELRQLQLTGELRGAELRAEQSEYLPQVTLFATYGYNAQADGGINPFGWGGANSSTSPQVGLQVSVPIFSGLSRPARVDQKRAALRQARTQHQLTRAQVENQIRTLLDQAREARDRATAQARAQEQARRGYEIAHAQFREGLGSRLELTDAEVALRQSEFNYAQAVYDYLSARAQLDEAVGASVARGG